MRFGSGRMRQPTPPEPRSGATSILKQHCDGRLPFETDARTIRFSSRCSVWSDAAAFRSLSSTGRIEEAIDLHSGEFLPFIDNEWIAAEREKMHVELRALLKRAAAVCYAKGEIAGSLRFLERLHALEPWHEDVVRALSTLRCCAGDRAGALATYVRFRFTTARRSWRRADTRDDGSFRSAGAWRKPPTIRQSTLAIGALRPSDTRRLRTIRGRS